MRIQTKKTLLYISLLCLIAALVFMFIPGSYLLISFSPEGTQTVTQSFYFSIMTVSYGVFPFWTGLFSAVWLILSIVKIATAAGRAPGKTRLTPGGVILTFADLIIGVVCAVLSLFSLAFSVEITVLGIFIAVFSIAAVVLRFAAVIFPAYKAA